MAESLDPKLARQVAKTQDLLGPFVKKSLLVEKHLARPPFRQLHDIIMNITDSTGFFKGLFTPDELDSANIKTKEAKVAFLQKVFDVVALATGQPLDVKPSKVLSGLEVEKTNDFLQSLGKALKTNLKSTEAVKTVSGKAGPSPTEPAKEPSKPKPTKDVVNKPTARTKDPSPAKKPTVGGGAKAPDKSSTKPKEKEIKDKAKPAATTSTQKAKAGSNERLNANTKPSPMRVLPPSKSKEKERERKPSLGDGGGSGPSSRRSSLTNIAAAAATATEPKSTSRPRSGSLNSTNQRSSSSTKIVDTTAGQLQELDPSEVAEVMGDYELLLKHGYEADSMVDDDDDNADSESLTNSILDDSFFGCVEFDDNNNVAFQAASSDKDGPQSRADVNNRDSTSTAAGSRKAKPVVVAAGNLDDTAGQISDDPVKESSATSSFFDTMHDEMAKSEFGPGSMIPETNMISTSSTNSLESLDQNTGTKSAAVKQQPASSRNLVSGRDKEATATAAVRVQSVTGRNNSSIPAPAQTPAETNSGETGVESQRSGFFTRPLSARPGAPRPKTASTSWNQEESHPFRPPTSKVTNVLLDTADENADEDETERFIIQEKVGLSSNDTNGAFKFGGSDFGKAPFGSNNISNNTDDDGINIEDLAPEQRGFLVNQILETKRELEDNTPGQLNPFETELNEKERSKLHQNWEADIGKLKDLLQTIARASNPLGKLMDYVQEDMDTMLNEVTKYKDENRSLDLQIEEEQKKLKLELEPLQKQLDEIDYLIKDQEDAVISTKLEVLSQEQKIDKILHGLELIPTTGNGTLDPKKLPKSIKVFGVDVKLMDGQTTIGDTGIPFRHESMAELEEILAASASSKSSGGSRNMNNVEAGFLSVPEQDLNSLVLEEDDLY